MSYFYFALRVLAVVAIATMLFEIVARLLYYAGKPIARSTSRMERLVGASSGILFTILYGVIAHYLVLIADKFNRDDGVGWTGLFIVSILVLIPFTGGSLKVRKRIAQTYIPHTEPRNNGEPFNAAIYKVDTWDGAVMNFMALPFLFVLFFFFPSIGNFLYGWLFSALNWLPFI